MIFIRLNLEARCRRFHLSTLGDETQSYIKYSE